MINKRSIAFQVFARRIITSFSVDKMFPLTNVNWFTKFRDLPLKVKKAPFCLKHMYSIFFAFR